MPNMNPSFGGQELIIPGAYYQDNVDAAANTAAAGLPPLIFIGNAYGLPPLTPVAFATQQDLQAALRGGPAADFLQFMFTPSGDVEGCSNVTFINVGQNTQAGFALKDSAGTTVLNLASANYGAPENMKQISVGAGSTAGVEITLLDGYSGNTVSADNLGVPFSLEYTGEQVGVTYLITNSQMVIASPLAAESLTVPLGPSGYGTVSALVAYLNSTGYYVADVISNGALPTGSLDLVSGQALTAGTTVEVTATLGDIVYWMTQSASAIVNPPVIPAGIVSGPTVLPAVIALTHFTGGTNVPPVLANYAAAFNAALKVPGWVVFADSNNSAVQALGAEHVTIASGVANRKGRRFVSGSSIGDTVASAVAASKAMDTRLTTYVYPGIYRSDPNTGLNTLYGGIYAAAAAAGIMCGNLVMTPLTNKTLTGNGLEVDLDITDIQTLQNNGVQGIYIPDTTGVPTLLSDVTTWQDDSNPENVFNQQVAGRLYLGYVLIQALQAYTGVIESKFGQAVLRRAVISALNQQVVSSTSSTGVLSSWDPTSLVINYSGSQQVTSVTFNGTLVGQNRFTLITANIQSLSLSSVSSTSGS